jgi:ABC-type Zn uptake system ZnuABC Zn-binding protein ZnuA
MLSQYINGEMDDPPAIRSGSSIMSSELASSLQSARQQKTADFAAKTSALLAKLDQLASPASASAAAAASAHADDAHAATAYLSSPGMATAIPASQVRRWLSHEQTRSSG